MRFLSRLITAISSLLSALINSTDHKSGLPFEGSCLDP